ncbi:TetR/AcrR family transcriptional regulator [Aureimonas altamirensis]|uniref:TetR/AcrR family transcriptional regulator n=1 Tax=Aureimonas altamirensis TaxID=370622 RepID=UPI00203708A4|nr:TetR/AcrR family transcriptional regulator [Aureimonas altamirensis]MCM2505518.1 TetR/AcrR family transcriptional regulator [Aureimonas altamirensis]
MARGRPRSFDRDAALTSAMEVFWAKGYEGTQLSELMAAIGINPPSFYAAFNSKEAIFREAVDLYLSTVGAGSMRALAERANARDAIEAMLLASAEIALASPSSGGCMVSLGLVNCQSQNAGLRNHMRDLRRTTLLLIRERLERGVAEGDLLAGTDAGRLASYFATVMQGLSLQAQDGATRDDLRSIVETAMDVLNDRPIQAKR